MNLTYERMVTPRAMYRMSLDGNVVAMISQDGVRSWTAYTIAKPRLSCIGETRHAAGLALIEAMTDVGILER